MGKENKFEEPKKENKESDIQKLNDMVTELIEGASQGKRGGTIGLVGTDNKYIDFLQIFTKNWAIKKKQNRPEKK